jgi:hypothetical protein
MLDEYAIEPEAMGASWSDFRYLAENFGFDQGRLISRFPHQWFNMVLDAAKALPDVERKRVTVGLERAKRVCVIDTRRPYNPRLAGWFENAVTEHARLPFHAIIARANPQNADRVLTIGEIDGSHRLFVAERDGKVDRNAGALAEVAARLLSHSKTIMFVDGYYDPSDRRYQRAFRAYLDVVAKNGSAEKTCEIHYVDHDRKPTSEAIEREATAWFRGVIPKGMAVTLYRWKRRDGGEEFHARYILTERGGMRFDEGLAEGRAGERSDVALMDLALVQGRREALHRDTVVFELVEPVLLIASNGYVEQV